MHYLCCWTGLDDSIDLTILMTLYENCNCNSPVNVLHGPSHFNFISDLVHFLDPQFWSAEHVRNLTITVSDLVHTHMLKSYPDQ